MVHTDLVQIVEQVKAPRKTWCGLAPAFVCCRCLALFKGDTRQPPYAPLRGPARRVNGRD